MSEAQVASALGITASRVWSRLPRQLRRSRSDTASLIGRRVADRLPELFGRRHFMELTASLTAPPEFTLLAGRTEIGTTDPTVLTEERQDPRRLLLAGRSWQVTFTDWARRRAFVEPVEDEDGGPAK